MFRKAERKLAKLRIGLTGLAGSGKTWSALALATGFSGKIALLDTERRGHLYASDFKFDICELDAPYTTERYIAAIEEAEKLGYETLIIDSLSHAWQGDGGILSLVDSVSSSSRNSNSYIAWGKATPKYGRLIDKIITSSIHIIVTLRSKAEYVQDKNENGKMIPRKIGLAPIMRDGIEYEFTIFCELDCDHVASVSKDNTRLYQGQQLILTSDIGSKLSDWMASGKTTEEIKEQEIKNIIEECQSVFNSVNNIQDLREALLVAQNTHHLYKDIIQYEAKKRYDQLSQGELK